MANFIINNETTLQAILFVLDNIGGKTNFLKLYKILYFADQKHLVKYGRPITGDTYLAMQRGPVPSYTRNHIDSLKKGVVQDAIDKKFQAAFTIIRDEKLQLNFIVANIKPDLEELSESDKKCLLESLEENKHLTTSELSKKSHQIAWENAIATEDEEISMEDIAREGGADEEMIKFILLNIENQELFYGK